MAKPLDWFRLRNEYEKHRATWPAKQALRAARVHIKWRDMRGVFIPSDEADIIRDIPDWVPFIWDRHDEEPYDASYVYTWGLSKGRAERIEREILERADADGVFFYMAGYRAHGEEEIVDSIGGFIGDDFIGSGYDIDLMEAAMDAAEEAQSQAVQRKLKEAMEEMT